MRLDHITPDIELVFVDDEGRKWVVSECVPSMSEEDLDGWVMSHGRPFEED